MKPALIADDAILEAVNVRKAEALLDVGPGFNTPDAAGAEHVDVGAVRIILVKDGVKLRPCLGKGCGVEGRSALKGTHIRFIHISYVEKQHAIRLLPEFRVPLVRRHRGAAVVKIKVIPKKAIVEGLARGLDFELTIWRFMRFVR